MTEENALKYIRWQECISREEELEGLKKSKEWRVDTSTGNLREVHKVTEAYTDLKINRALARRGAALDCANVMRTEHHDVLMNMLIRELQRVPPAGHQRVTHEQLQRADKEAWRLVAEATATSGLRVDAAGELPAGEALRNVCTEATVRLLLMPLPLNAAAPQRSSQMSAASSSHQGAAQSPPPKRRKKQQQQQQQQRQQTQEKSGTGTQLPPGLKGATATPDGARICFAYNLVKCTQQQAKGCTKGKHVCTQCFGTHPFALCGQQD
eukprot:5687788-Amphidinium_carterae.1